MQSGEVAGAAGKDIGGRNHFLVELKYVECNYVFISFFPLLIFFVIN